MERQKCLLNFKKHIMEMNIKLKEDIKFQKKQQKEKKDKFQQCCKRA